MSRSHSIHMRQLQKQISGFSLDSSLIFSCVKSLLNHFKDVVLLTNLINAH